jgi:hypothetical protein
VELYAESAPPFRGVTGEEDDASNGVYESPLLSFLLWSNYVKLEAALQECERRTPPLYNEMVRATHTERRRGRRGRRAEIAGRELKRWRHADDSWCYLWGFRCLFWAAWRTTHALLTSSCARLGVSHGTSQVIQT